MPGKIKKIILVILLTLAIWAWAFLKLKQSVEVWGTIRPSTSPDVLVSFVNREIPVYVKMELEGPPTRIAEFRKKTLPDAGGQKKEDLHFLYSPNQGKKDTLTDFSLDVSQFLRDSEKIKSLGLTVISCEPEGLQVKIENLVEKSLKLQVIDEATGLPLAYEAILSQSGEAIDSIKMFVHNSWADDPAVIELTAPQIERARKDYVSAEPYIELATGEKRVSANVQVKLHPIANPVQIYPLQLTKIGYIYGPELLEKISRGGYAIELQNKSELTEVISLKATDEALTAYKAMRYQILIEIRDDDDTQDIIPREVIYNFPPEYFKKGEIQLNAPPREAKFKLIQIPETP